MITAIRPAAGDETFLAETHSLGLLSTLRTVQMRPGSGPTQLLLTGLCADTSAMPDGSTSPARAMRSRASGEDGFTLIELLVVMIVIGILAAIAIPSLLSQRNGANDAGAKQMAGTAEHAGVIYSLNNGSYTGMTASSLKTIEPSLNITANGQTVLASAGATVTGYSVAAVSSAGDTFNIIVSNGGVSRTCTVAAGNGNTTTNTGGGCTNGTW